MIKIEHLKKEYPNTTPLKDVNVVINDGDIIAVIGPSGTGKSTLLRCINLLETPTSGNIYIDNTDITSPDCNVQSIRQKLGMVFQSFNLFGHMTVIENIMFSPMELLHQSRQEAYDNGIRLLKSVGLVEKALNYPDELSGGQKQRVAIARTLAMDPDIILFDEPTSALDPTMVGEVQSVIRELSKTGKTMMIVTHEMKFARAISNRVFYMDEGGIYEEGTPEQIFDTPRLEKTIQFINSLKILELNIINKNYDFLGMQSEIVAYCNKNQVPAKMTRHIQLIFEELIQQLILPAISEPKVSSVIEYSEKNEDAIIKISYNGTSLDVTKKGDSLSLAVLGSAIENISYECNEDNDLQNKLTIKVKQ